MIKIHPIRTGSVRIKTAQRRRKTGGLARVLIDPNWTEWLPIYAWVVEHPEGTIMVDTGETARTSEPGYFPGWHPYFRWAMQTRVKPKEEIGPQLQALGIDPHEVPTVILTHFHTDHAGGLHHFPQSRILVSGPGYGNARGLSGQVQGYLPQRWPDWFAPVSISWEPFPAGSFERSHAVTRAGDVLIVPTPGHTPHHVSVIVKTEELSYFLAGDTSYSERLLVERHPDGVGLNAATTRQTMASILRYAQANPTVYLPSHDPESLNRLNHRHTINPPVQAQEATQGQAAWPGRSPSAT